MEYAAADWRCVSYERADGTALVGAAAAPVFPTTTDNDKTTTYSTVSGDVDETIVLTSGATANVAITHDVNLLTTAGQIIAFVNEDPDYRMQIIVSNTGTMTLGSNAIDVFLWEGETLTLGFDTATNNRILTKG